MNNKDYDALRTDIERLQQIRGEILDIEARKELDGSIMSLIIRYESLTGELYQSLK